MRLLFGMLVLAAVMAPQTLVAQAPQSETPATQTHSSLLISSSLQGSSAREEKLFQLDARKTPGLLNFANFPTDRGRYALFGANEMNEPAAAVSSRDRLSFKKLGAESSFRPPAKQKSPPTRLWRALLIAQHGAAVFDAWSTRDAIQNGGAHELNPLFRPFAGSNLIYPATQVGSGLLDYLGYRMMKSKRSWMRRLWWLPQLAGTAGSLFSGAHNLSVARGKP